MLRRGFLMVWLMLGSVPVGLAQPDSSLPPASIAVSPPRVELDLDAGRATQSIQLMNLSDKPTTISVSLSNWDLDENNKVRDVAPTEQSLDQWIVINPLHFTIAPKEQQTIRFAVRPRVKPTPGEHRAMIYFEQQPDEEQPEANVVSVRYRLGVAVYGLSGHIDRRGRIEAIRPTLSGENHYLDVDISSEGNASVRLNGQYAFWRADEFPGEDAATALLNSEQPADIGVHGLLPATPILPGTQRTVRIRLADAGETGAQVLFVSGDLAGRSFVRRVEVPPQ